MTSAGALSGMVVGVLMVLVWVSSPFKEMVYEMIPGFIAAFLAIVIGSLLSKKPGDDVVRWFDEMEGI